MERAGRLTIAERSVIATRSLAKGEYFWRESVQNRYIFIRLRGGFSPKIKDTLSLFSGEERKKNFFRNPRGNLGLSFLPHLSRFKRAILGRERERPESPGPGDKYWSWDQREDFAKNIFQESQMG